MLLNISLTQTYPPHSKAAKQSGQLSSYCRLNVAINSVLRHDFKSIITSYLLVWRDSILVPKDEVILGFMSTQIHLRIYPFFTNPFAHTFVYESTNGTTENVD